MMTERVDPRQAQVAGGPSGSGEEVSQTNLISLASIILAVGRGEATMEERVDPRRGQAALVGGERR